MVVNGRRTNMFALGLELEQQLECGCLECELEQFAWELEQQCGLASRLRFHPQTPNGDSGATGMRRPAISEITMSLPFGRATEDREVQQ